MQEQITLMSETRQLGAGAFRIGEDLRVYPVARTVDGIGVDVPPVKRFTNSRADVAAIGSALRAILASPPKEPAPRYWNERKELGKQFLKSAGVRSWREIQLHAVSCWIEIGDKQIFMTPLRNGGTRGDQKGFQPFGAAPVMVGFDEPDVTLGAALIAALDASA